MSKYHIALCSDNNYIPYCLVTCQSIIDSLDISNKERDTTLVFHIIVDDGVNINQLQDKCRHFSARNKCTADSEFIIHTVDTSLFRKAPTLRGSYGTYYRILLDKILPTDINIILYLDVDILVRKDIISLFKRQPLINTVLAACVDLEVDTANKTADCVVMKSLSSFNKDLYIRKREYINAGVLLINLDEWREQNISAKCLDILSTHNPARHDQDLLNYVVKSKSIMSMDWNFHIFNFFLGFNKDTQDYSNIPSKVNSRNENICNNTLPKAEELERIAKDPSIIHFTYIKPWGPIDCFYSELPRVKNSNIFKFIEEWHTTARKVTEFSNELSSLDYCQFTHYDFIDCLINHKVSVNQQNIAKLINGRKKDKKGLISAIVFLLIMQIITFIILFLK